MTGALNFFALIIFSLQIIMTDLDIQPSTKYSTFNLSSNSISSNVVELAKRINDINAASKSEIGMLKSRFYV